MVLATDAEYIKAEEFFVSMNKRRKITKKERLSPCTVCGYGISQRHHLLEVSFWEENNATVQLCANCHELYHLMRDVKDDVYLGKILIRLGITGADGRNRIWKIKGLVDRAGEFEKLATQEVIKKSNEL